MNNKCANKKNFKLELININNFLKMKASKNKFQTKKNNKYNNAKNKIQKYKNKLNY